MGISPVNAWFLAWFAMVPLWCHVRQAIESQAIESQAIESQATKHHWKWRDVLVGAGLWGMAYHAVALSWVTGLHPMTWLGFTWLESFLAIVAFAWVFVSIWATLIVIVWSGLMIGLDRLVRKIGAGKGLSVGSQILLGTALWCAIEWIWSQGPLYWSSLSFTQSPGNLWILQLGRLSGHAVVTAAIVAVNGLLAEVWLRRADVRMKRVYLRWAIALAIALHLIGLGFYVQPLSDRPDNAVKVGLVQGNIPTIRKLTASGIQESRKVYLEGYESLAAQGAELVITPEGAIPQRWNSFLQSQNLLQRAVVKNGVPLVLGTFVHQDIDDRTTPITQSLLTLTPNSKVSGRYQKVKLAPLGEYLPFENILLPIIGRSPFGSSMVPGTFDQHLQTPLGPFAAGICYESAFPRVFQQQVHKGAWAILTASNNDPYPLKQMAQHHGQDVMRAIETDRWEVRVTNTGISGVVDPKGRSHWLSNINTRTTHLAKIYQRRTRTLYVRVGDWLTPLLLISSGIMVLRSLKRKPLP